MADYSGGFLFQAGPNFNYLKYLEEKSHFDRLQMSVSSDVKRLVATNEYLAEKNIRAAHQATSDIIASIYLQTKEISSKLDAGFDLLSVEISQVRKSVESLSSICETGFSEISLELSHMNEAINQLIRIAKSPDQTWAFEQFEISRDSFRRRLFSDALEYINRAISGYGDRPGYKLEHRFHYLRGLIHLGNEKNFDPNIVDLVTAVEDFQASARYADHVDDKAVARGFQMAGWASYCKGDFSASENFLSKSLSYYEEDLHSNFLMAKTLLRIGDTKRAKPFFAYAMYGDINYALRAGADPDFLDHKHVLEGWIEEYRADLISDCNELFADIDLAALRSKWPILISRNFESDQSKLEELEKNLGEVDQAPLSRLLDLVKSIKSLKMSIAASISSAQLSLQARAKNLADSKVEKKKNDSALGVGSGFIAAVVTFLFCMALATPDIISGGLIGGSFEFVMAAIVSAIISLIAALVVTPLMAFISSVIHEGSHAKEVASHKKKTSIERDDVVEDLNRLSD